MCKQGFSYLKSIRLHSSIIVREPGGKANFVTERKLCITLYSRSA